jgi:hypothetical protein
MVLRQSQQYKAEGYVYPGGRIEFRKAVEQKKQFPAPLGCPIRTRQIYSPKALEGRDGGLGWGEVREWGGVDLRLLLGWLMVAGWQLCWVCRSWGDEPKQGLSFAKPSVAYISLSLYIYIYIY